MPEEAEDTQALEPPSMESQLDQVRSDLEKIALHLVPLLRNSYSDTKDRLARAEKLLATRSERPLISGVHQILASVRRLSADTDLRGFVEESLVDLLERQGYDEFGDAGDPFDLTKHDPLGGQTERGIAKISRVHRKGLACGDDVIIRAKVEVVVETEADAAAPVDGLG